MSDPRWPSGIWPADKRTTVPPATLRIGDAERELAASDLHAHALAGRLTVDEYAERLAAAHAARTWGDLYTIFGDLPALRPLAATSTPTTGYPPVGPIPAQVSPPERWGRSYRRGHPFLRLAIGVWILLAVSSYLTHGLVTLWFLLWPVITVMLLFRFAGVGRRRGRGPHRPRSRRR